MQWGFLGLKGTPRFCWVSLQASRRQRVFRLQCDVSIEFGGVFIECRLLRPPKVVVRRHNHGLVVIIIYPSFTPTCFTFV